MPWGPPCVFPLKRGDFSGPSGGADWIPAMAGPLHPPFSLFLPEEKEKTGRARSKREKEVTSLRGDGRRGTRKSCFRRLRKFSVRGVVRAGVLVLVEWTFSSFRCRWPDAGLRGLSPWSGHSPGIAPPGGIVGYA